MDARGEAPDPATAANGGHARRKLCEVHDSHRSTIAAEGLRRRRCTPSRRRSGGSRPRSADRTPGPHSSLVEDFGVWLRRQRARVSPKSRLGEKLAYIRNHWDGL